MKRLLLCTMTLALASGGHVWADLPAHPTAREKAEAAAVAAHRRAADRTSPTWSPSPEEEADAKTFLEKNCPHRLDAVKRTSTDGKVPTKLVRSFYDLEALRAAEPDLYEIKVKQVRLEDHIFALVDTTIGKSNPDAELREQVRQLIQLRIDEHQKRLDKLKAVTDAEQQKLNQLKNNTEKMIEAEVEKQKKSPDRITKPGSNAGPSQKNGSPSIMPRDESDLN